MTIIVSVGKEEAVVSEQTVDATVGHIAEMLTDPLKIDSFIPGLSNKAKVLAESNGDENPEYPIVRVEEGWSGNNRLWDAQELDGIAAQVNSMEPVGHWGHIKEENLSWEAPEPQTTWIGAITKTEPSQSKDRKGEMVRVFYAAGYNLPGAKIRTYIKSRAVKGVSWLGTCKQIQIPGKGVQVRDFTLKTLDWARKGAEGMPTTAIVGVASEMEGAGMDKALSQVTPEEFEKENPNGFALIVSKATAEKDEIVSEMETKVEAAQADTTLIAELRKLLNLDEKSDVLEVIGNLMKKSGEMVKGTYEDLLDKILKQKVSDDDSRKLVRRLILAETPAAEMGNFNTEELVSEMVEKKFNEDDQIQVIVSEQSSGRNIARTTKDRSGNGYEPGKSTGSLVTGSTKLG